MNEATPPGDTALDRERRALSVPRRLMPAILAIHAGDSPRDSAEAAELETSGVTAADHLDPLVTTLINIMTSPTLVITAEVAGGSRQRLVTIWATATGAVVGTTSDRHQFELLQIEPELMVFHLAQATGLSPGRPVLFTGGCSLPAAALRSAEALIAEDADRAAALLRIAGASSLWAGRICDALARRRTVWTVESVWLGQGRRKARSSLKVLDAGRAGYWRMTDRGSADTVSLDVAGFDDLLAALFSLLPGHCPR